MVAGTGILDGGLRSMRGVAGGLDRWRAGGAEGLFRGFVGVRGVLPEGVDGALVVRGFRESRRIPAKCGRAAGWDV